MEYSKISVIIRGLVVGNDQPDENKKFTKRALASVREHLPGAQIILSSWKGGNVAGLDYDDLILSDPPPSIYMTLEDGTPKFIATNNLIVATQKGLEKVRGEYTIILRSDTMLTGTGFIDYFAKFNKTKDSDILEKRVVVLPTYNPRRVSALLFNLPDWFYFGLTEDIKKLFDIPLMKESDLRGEKINGYYPREENFEAEQYMWVAFLKKYKNIPLPHNHYFSQEALKASEESYARNTIMLPADKAGVLCLKMPHAGYTGRPLLSQGLYTFNEYKKMYNEYSSSKVFYFPNPIEIILYPIFLNVRMTFKRLSPERYKKIVNFVRRCYGSSDLIK